MDSSESTGPTRVVFPVAPLSRRTVVAGGCAVVCLAGCARYGAEDSAPTNPEPATAAGSSGASGNSSGGAPASGVGGGAGVGVVAIAAVPVGGGVIVADRGLVVTQPTAGVFAAFGTTCPHQGCSVNEVVDGTINCPCHGSRFRVEDGSVARGPAKKGLPARVAAAVEGQVHVS